MIVHPEIHTELPPYSAVSGGPHSPGSASPEGCMSGYSLHLQRQKTRGISTLVISLRRVRCRKGRRQEGQPHALNRPHIRQAATTTAAQRHAWTRGARTSAPEP